MPNNLHCGACGTPFDDTKELMAHIDICAEAQGTDAMALDRFNRVKGRFGSLRKAIDEIDRWDDDGGQA